MRHPPVHTSGCGDVHDDVAKLHEGGDFECLGEEVGVVVFGIDEGYCYPVRLDELSNSEVVARDVFRLVVVLRVVCEVASRLVVHGD